MSSMIYENLREYLDKSTPTGFPKTESGVEIEILKRLFTPDQAEAYIHLSLTPEPLAAIAERMGKDAEETARILSDLDDAGLVLRVSVEDMTAYSAMPFAPGIMEAQIRRFDADLAKKFQVFLDEGWGEALVKKGRVGLSRTLVVEESVSPDKAILPYERIDEFIEKAQRPRAVTHCYCKSVKKSAGEACSKPTEVCIPLGPFATLFIEKGLAREIDDDEFRSIMKTANEAGLVPSVFNSAAYEDQLWLCNCCKCCCVCLSSMDKLYSEDLEGGQAATSFIASINEEVCSGCEICIDRCQVTAITMEDGVARLKPGRCLGCGLCVTTCPEEAITLVKREEADMVKTPESWSELVEVLAKQK